MYRPSLYFIIIYIIWCAQCGETARILGVFSFPSISHQVVFRTLTLELAKRGHELVVLTTDPAFSDKRHSNVTEIDTSDSYKELLKKDSSKILKRGVIVDLNADTADEFRRLLVAIITNQFRIPVVKDFLADKAQKFDLVIVEAMLNYPLIVGKIFNAPVIQFSSFYGTSENYEIMGAPAWHPLYYPSTFRSKHGELSLWDRIHETYMEWILYRMSKEIEDIENKMLKEHYGADAPTVTELQQNVQLLFLNAHPIMVNNRPVPPSVIYLGGLHLKPVKELPLELKSYLDNSTRGVIYVSLGTNVRPSMMDQDFLDAFLEAFKALPYDILWKFDGDHLENVPKNVKMQKWFPQRDLLMHPNIKLFVMQGGLQSTDEAIEAGVPLVGIPILGDQWYNVNRYVELGIGVHVDAETMTASDLTVAVGKVLGDEAYRKNMRRLRAIVKDQPQTPLERAVWWTEHLLRHGGGQHLRAPAAHKTWVQYYMVDVVLTVLGFVLACVIALVVLCSKILSALTINKVKSKQS